MPARTRLASKALETAGVKPTPSSPIPVPTRPSRSKKAAATTTTTSVSASTPPTPAPSLTDPIHHFQTAIAWESWLETNHSTLPPTGGVWLKLHKKGSRVPCITYDAALDAALCFGWIDGQKRGHDADHFLQRFTPRRRGASGSMWSRRNVEKVAALEAAGRMRAAGLEEVEMAKADGRWERAYDAASVLEVPADVQAVLDAEGNGRARAAFQGLGRTKKYSFLWGLRSVKREETRRRKIGEFVASLVEGKTA